MEGKRRPTLSELRVGIFVVAAVTILAVAIFTIGTQVGLFEETFAAKTYLNNVSGLKPGDIVLLGGVEVGNVTDVSMEGSEELPETQANQRTSEELLFLERAVPPLEERVAVSRTNLAQLRDGNAPPEEIIAAENRLQELQDDLDRARRKLEQARGNLQNIAVYMQISSTYRSWIKKDSHISLGSIGLLGDKYIEISIGRTDIEPVVILEEVDGMFGTDTREVVTITGQRQSGFQELITGANDILANFETLSEQLQTLMNKFEEGEGTVGKFFSDPSFYNNLNSAVESAKTAADEAAQMLRDITEGEGTIPNLIREKDLYDRINSVAENLDATMLRVNEGVGTMGKFVNDPSIYDKTDEALSNIGRITDRIADGQGTLGKLSADEQLYNDLRDSLDKISTFMADIEAGKGTLGRLTKDEQLYQNLNEVSSEIVKLLYDFRQNPKRFLTIKLELF